MKRRDGYALALLGGIGLLVRILVAARGGLWRDEGLFLFIVRSNSWSAMIDFLRFHESHPPMFYAIMRVWLSMFGTSEAAAVALPIVLGVALVPLIYFVGASLLSRRAGLLAAAFAAVSPASTQYSALIRPYSLLPLLTLVSVYMLVTSVQRGGRRAWITYVLSTLALLYTHNWGWLVLGGEWVASIALIVRGIERDRWRVLFEWVLAQCVIAIAYLPWAFTLVYQLHYTGHPPSLFDLREQPVADFAAAARTFLRSTVLGYRPREGSDAVDAVKGLILAVPLILLALDQFFRVREIRRAGQDTIAARHPKSERPSASGSLMFLLLMPVAAWLAALVLSIRTDAMQSRNLVMLAPCLILLLAYWLLRARKGIRLFLAQSAAVALVAGYCLTLYDLTQTTSSNARELAAAVASRTRPSDLLIIAPWLASSFNYYYEPMNEQIDYPHFGRAGTVDFARVLERLADDSIAARTARHIAEARRTGRRTWLIADRDNLAHVEPNQFEELIRSRIYREVAEARVIQLREQLESEYGPPDMTLVAGNKSVQYENLRALLFSSGVR